MKSMIRLIVTAAILLSSPCISTTVDLEGDANLYKYVISSLKQLEIERAEEKLDEIQRASKVCYGDLGCFDKEETFKHLKQLPEPPETVNTQFMLYTRKSSLEPQMLDYKQPESILNSNLDPKLPLKFITHGFGGHGNLTWLWNLKSALLESHDVNVIAVDWSVGARLPYYIQGAVNTELVGAEMALMFYFIKDKLGILEKDLHCIGFSLGAQVMGFVGKRMIKMRGTKPGRMTGLDPAAPLFENYGGSVHLSKEDADFVDVVHTNGDLLIYGGVGMSTSVGDVDFFPNGGKRQPGCKSTIGGALKDMFKNDREHACNHERAVLLFTDSILHPERCRYLGYSCGNYSEFLNAQCMTCGNDGCGHMGYHVEGTGIYYLMTKANPPFCSELVKMTVEFSTDVKKSYGAILLTLVGAGGVEQNVTLTDKDEKLMGGDRRNVIITLEEGVMPLSSVEVLYSRYNGWFTKGQETFGLGSVVIQDNEDNYMFKTCEGSVILKDQEYQTLPTSCTFR